MSSIQLTHAQKSRQQKLETTHAQQKLYGTSSQLTQDDHFVYFNQSIKNTTFTTQDIKASFEANRRDIILENPSDYVIAVDRFKIPANLIPILEFEDNTYEVIMTYDGAEVREFMVWVPTTNPQISRQWIFHYQHFLDILNATISSVHATLLALKPAMSNDLPFVTYDPTSKLFDLYFDDTWLNTPDTANLGMNQPLWSLFEFHSESQLLSNENVDYYELKALNTFNNFVALTTPLVPYSDDFYISRQPFQTLNTWSPISRIIIATNRLPVRRELIGSQQSVSEQILTDFVVGHDNVDNLEYIFNATRHRWHDLESNQPLKDIDIVIEWENYQGVRHPIFISYNREASIKLLFKQRGLITTD